MIKLKYREVENNVMDKLTINNAQMLYNRANQRIYQSTNDYNTQKIDEPKLATDLLKSEQEAKTAARVIETENKCFNSLIDIEV